MINLPNCTSENNTIIKNIILKIIFFRQFYSSQYEDYFEPQIKTSIDDLLKNLELEDPSKFILSVFLNLNHLNTLRLDNLDCFNDFFQSNLFLTFNKLIQLGLTNIEIFQELLAVPASRNLEQLLDNLILNKLNMLNVEIFLSILKTFHLVAEDSYNDYIFCLQLLNDLRLLNPQIVTMLGEDYIEIKKRVILYLVETQLIQRDFGQHYLAEVLNNHNIEIYDEIFRGISPYFLNDPSNLQFFLLKLFNNPKNCPLYLKELQKSLEILHSNELLKKTSILDMIGIRDRTKLNSILICFDSLPKHVFNEDVLKKIFQNLSSGFKNPSNSLIEFVEFCNEYELFNDINQGKINLLNILKISQHHRLFKKIIEVQPFNGHYNQLKLDMLLICSEYMDPNRFIHAINILEKNHLFAYLTHAENFKIFITNSSATSVDKYNALEILSQAGLIKSNASFADYLELIHKTDAPISLAHAALELSANPVRFSDETRKLIKLKDFCKFDDPLEFLKIINKLSTHQLLTKENFKKIYKPKYGFFKSLQKLVNEVSFSEAQLKFLLTEFFSIQKPNYYNLASGIILLQHAGILELPFYAERLPRIFTHANPYDLCSSLVILHQSNLPLEKLKSYSEQCFSWGTNIYYLTVTPLNFSPHLLKYYNNCYLVYGNTIFFIEENAIKNSTKFDSSISKKLNSNINASIESDTFILTDNILKSFLEITQFTPRQNSCENYAKSMIELENNHLLSDWFEKKYLKKLIAHSNPHETTQALVIIHKKEQFNTANNALIKSILQHEHPLSFMRACDLIEENHIPVPEIFQEKLAIHPDPLNLTQAAELLIQHHFFSNPIFHDLTEPFLTTHDPLNFAKCIIALKEEKLVKKMISFKKFVLALNEPQINLDLFTKCIVHLNQQNLISTNSISQLRIFLKESVKFPELEEFIRLLLDLPDNTIILTPDLLKTILENKNSLPDLNKDLVEIIHIFELEYFNECKQELLELFITKPTFTETIIELIKFCLEQNLLNANNKRFIIECLKKGHSNLNRIDYLHYGNVFFLKQLATEGYNLDRCILQMQTNPILTNFILSISSIYMRNDLKAILYKLFFNGEINPPDEKYFFQLIIELDKTTLLNQDSIKKISSFSKNLYSIFSVLVNNDVMNLENFNFFIAYQAFFDNPQLLTHFNRIPYRGLNLHHFTNIKTICARHAQEATDPSPVIIDYIRHNILEIPREFGQLNLNPNEFNTRQSTHTATVHDSVSESLIKMLARHHSQISEDLVALNNNKIRDFIFSLQSTHKNDAAKRYWDLINSQSAYLNYKDPKSKMKIKQLLHLFWISIHDFSVRIHDPADTPQELISNGLLLLTEAFYEAQRDGNINGNGGDDLMLDDKFPICPPGFINKLTEKLVGIHPDVQITIINHQIAGEKLKAIVSEKVINAVRLQIQAKKQTDEKLDDEFINKAVEEIWPTIKDEVAEIFFNEFKVLFKNSKDNENFLTYMELGQDIELSEKQIDSLHKLNQKPSRKRQAQDAFEEDLEPMQDKQSLLGFSVFSPPTPMEYADERTDEHQAGPSSNSPI